MEDDFTESPGTAHGQHQEHDPHFQEPHDQSPHSDLDQDGVRDEEEVDEVHRSCTKGQVQTWGDVQCPSDVLDGHKEDLFADVLQQGLLEMEKIQDQHPAADVDRGSSQDRELTTAAANEDEAGRSCDSFPALVVTHAEEPSVSLAKPPPSPEPSESPGDPVRLFTESSLICSSDGGDVTCPDLLSLRSDSMSLASETTVSRRSEEDDTRSMTSSSVTSLFHRLQLDPLEKAWWRSSVLGNMAAQRQLLAQDPSLVMKKDFITTALHWAAKQGRQEVVDMMLRSGADVNARSGYTPLHLASIHGHRHVVHSLVNNYNAKIGVRDYHGKTAAHYWSGCSDVFHRAETQEGGRFFRGRQTQRNALSSLLMSRSRSQGQLNLELGATPQSSSYDTLDLQL